MPGPMRWLGLSSPPARARALVLAALLVGLVGLACGTKAADDANGDGGASNETAADQAACPKDGPAPGDPCLLPEGTTCDFGACGTRLARCTSRVWVYSTTPTPSPPCPPTPPEPGVSCSACWPVDKTCSYFAESCLSGDAGDAGAPQNTATASCVNGAWVIDIRPCYEDAGADVQGDGEAGHD